ncbi:MAG: helix-turn-helix transcriptional regulator [Chloroflexi bacterium]|nr:MAG: helix-turn-helix transcriptional regulator [Chloroflexota bacterium]
MPNNGRAEPIGELIRQLRRRRNITQTELGAPRYSKSYVSAVEKNTIRPVRITRLFELWKRFRPLLQSLLLPFHHPNKPTTSFLRE